MQCIILSIHLSFFSPKSGTCCIGKRLRFVKQISQIIQGVQKEILRKKYIMKVGGGNDGEKNNTQPFLDNYF